MDDEWQLAEFHLHEMPAENLHKQNIYGNMAREK